MAHEFDADAVCLLCGFDGAEWWHLERMKPKEDREPEPPCAADSTPTNTVTVSEVQK